jgi:predicted nuclease of predicted toxin-antitoxin system
MRIKLDENLPAELADDLRGLGHLVDTVVDEGLAGNADPLVADAARRTRRCLFSLDKGLGDIRRYPPKDYYGIVLFRFRRVESLYAAAFLICFRRSKGENRLRGCCLS